jgi:hypothetical protein
LVFPHKGLVYVDFGPGDSEGSRRRHEGFRLRQGFDGIKWRAKGDSGHRHEGYDGWILFLYHFGRA